MKKILSLILAGLMTLSCAAFVAADDAEATAEEATSFEDYALEFLVNKNIWKGVSAEELIADAESNVERWHMALLVSRISTGWLDDDQWEDDVANDSTFKDLEGTTAEKYLGAISYANQNGIIEGYSADKFGPEDYITYRDGLTMAVRTLGYKGLQYPWGYIEKAVELGLTEGIDKAYTADLTRGEVACILYNAMFAETKSGETLAKSIFDVDFGWENIVIVACRTGALRGFSKQDNLLAYDDAMSACPAGYAAFKILGADGTLGSETYYVKGQELGLKHDGAIKDAFGAVYIALFEVGDKGIVSMVDAESCLLKTVYSTENKKQIKLELMKYTLVDKYYDTPYISEANKPELMVSSTTSYLFLSVNDKQKVAMDITTGNIWESYSTGSWQIAWYYDPYNEVYYHTYWDKGGNKIAFDYLDKTEFEEWYQTAVTKTGKAWGPSANLEAEDCYAKLDMYDVDGDGVADRANYKAYKLSKLAYDADLGWNGDDEGRLIDSPLDFWTEGPDYGGIFDNTISGVGTWNWNGLYVNMLDDGWTWTWPEGTDSMYTNFDVYPTAIANVDGYARHVEVLKVIPYDSEDENNTIITGMLKGYSIPQTNGTAKINLDGRIITLGYDSLPGSIFNSFWDQWGNLNSHGVITAQWLNKLLWTKVEVTIVDGRVVDIDPCVNSNEENAIIVLGYAGVTANDNLIAVYGYSIYDIFNDLNDEAIDPSVKIYKIASINGWNKGDYKYYPMNALDDEFFMPGTIYTINDYDEELDAYHIETKTVADLKASAAAVSSVEFERGWIFWDGNASRMSENDKYLFIDDSGAIKIYTGIVEHEEWKIENALYKEVCKVKDAKGNVVDSMYVFFTNENSTVLGFNDNTYKTDLVMYDSNSYVLSYSFDADITNDAFLGSGDRLLGTVQQSMVHVRNLMNGQYTDVVAANNVEFKVGKTYVVVGNTIIGEWYGFGTDFDDYDYTNVEDFIEKAKDLYWNEGEAIGSFNTDGTRYMIFDAVYDQTEWNGDFNGFVFGELYEYYNYVHMDELFYWHFFSDWNAGKGDAFYAFNVAANGNVSLTKVDPTKWAEPHDVAVIFDAEDGRWTVYDLGVAATTDAEA